jgi:hypothetical protein
MKRNNYSLWRCRWPAPQHREQRSDHGGFVCGIQEKIKNIDYNPKIIYIFWIVIQKIYIFAF